MRRCACLCVWFGGEFVVIEQRVLYLSWFMGWRLGKREQNFGVLMLHILLIFELLLSNLTNGFYLTKVAKFFGGNKIMQILL